MAQSQTFTAPHAHGTVWHRFSDAAKKAWIGYWTGKAQRATALALHMLDDRTLKDIGMDRSEIESVVYARTSDRTRSSERRITMCAGASGGCCA